MASEPLNPTSPPQHTAQEEKDASKEGGRPTAAINQRGPSTDFTALIDAIRREAQTNREEESREDRGRHFREYLTLIFVVATAIGVFYQASIFSGQLEEMRKAYGPIESQAATARDAIAISQRPIVYFLQSSFFTKDVENNDRKWGMTLGIGNSGNLPTKDFSYKVGCVPSPTKLSDPFNDKTARLAGSPLELMVAAVEHIMPLSARLRSPRRAVACVFSLSYAPAPLRLPFSSR
jgi:hypothetical protein